MKRISKLLSLLALCATSFLPTRSSAATTPRSPANQVFQFAYTGTCSTWPNGSTTKATTYLWIPEECPRIRGLVILATNVPEHMLVGHPAIREACRANQLALVWSIPTFWNFSKDAKAQEATQLAFLQQLLEGLAAVSGYDEVATVPWLPVGESGHLLMVTGLVDQRPDHCMAGICVKNPQYPKDRTVPMLWTLGTAQEWGQTKADPRVAWKSQAEGYRNWVNGRVNWPLSVVVEPATGHFYCTDEMAQLFGKYIAAAAKARLSDDGSPTLKPVDLDAGFAANIPVPGVEPIGPIPYTSTTPEQKRAGWFFDEATAKAAQDLARVNWDAETQLPGVSGGENITAKAFSFNSVSEITVTTDSEFSLETVRYDTVPEGFVGAGEKLAKTDGEPIAEWICGPFVPLGNNRFRIALDRTWKAGASYIVLTKEATGNVRRSVQPVAVRLQENRDGTPQTISFDPIADVKAGTASVALSAKSSADLPVDFAVISGPAIIEGGKVVLTKIPPRAKYPVEVVVAASQWGRATDPKVKTAEVVRQSFHILAP